MRSWGVGVRVPGRLAGRRGSVAKAEERPPLRDTVRVMHGASPSSAPASQRPLRRDAERNRERILSAAAVAFAEGGLSVTMDEIGRRAGVGVGTVYRRFPDKELLIEALFEQRLEELVELAEGALAHDDPWDGLVAFLERLLAVQACDRGLKEVALSTAHGQERVRRARGRLAPVVRTL